jgi:hypothetical protein
VKIITKNASSVISEDNKHNVQKAIDNVSKEGKS